MNEGRLIHAKEPSAVRIQIRHPSGIAIVLKSSIRIIVIGFGISEFQDATCKDDDATWGNNYGNTNVSKRAPQAVRNQCLHTSGIATALKMSKWFLVIGP